MDGSGWGTFLGGGGGTLFWLSGKIYWVGVGGWG